MKPLSTDTPDAPAPTTPVRPGRLALRVSGARVGSLARPTADGAVGVGGAVMGRGLPTRRLGLRVHTNSIRSDEE